MTCGTANYGIGRMAGRMGIVLVAVTLLLASVCDGQNFADKEGSPSQITPPEPPASETQITDMEEMAAQAPVSPPDLPPPLPAEPPQPSPSPSPEPEPELEPSPAPQPTSEDKVDPGDDFITIPPIAAPFDVPSIDPSTSGVIRGPAFTPQQSNPPPVLTPFQAPPDDLPLQDLPYERRTVENSNGNVRSAGPVGDIKEDDGSGGGTSTFATVFLVFFIMSVVLGAAYLGRKYWLFKNGYRTRGWQPFNMEMTTLNERF